MSLSVCMIVKDEEAVIARCLNCVSKFADEIIVVDTGSTDNTVEEVKKFTDEIYFFKWCGDFSAARNFSLEKASCNYVMWLDADDWISDESCDEIRRLVKDGEFDMAFLPYAAAFDGDTPSFVYYRERIFKRSGNYRFNGAVHEVVTPSGKIIYSSARINHKKIKSSEPLRNLKIYQRSISEGKTLDERSEFYYGRELLFNGMLRESVAVLEHFLTREGWIENKIEACIDLFKAYSALGENNKAINSLLRSLLLATPRSEVCCLLCGYFCEKGEIEPAIYWYKSALNCVNDGKNGAFINLDYCGYIPNMQLCVLHYRLGEYVTANEFNEAAGKLKPDSKEYLFNKNYFKTKLGEGV